MCYCFKAYSYHVKITCAHVQTDTQYSPYIMHSDIHYSKIKDAGVIHYNDVIMTTMASQITSLTVVYSIVCSGADQRKYQSSASLAFVRGIHWRPVNSTHKGPVTRKMFPFDDVIMQRIVMMEATSTALTKSLRPRQNSRQYADHERKMKYFESWLTEGNSWGLIGN